MWPPRKIPGAAFSVRKMLRYIDSAAMGNCFQAISQLHTEGFLTPTALWAAGVRNGNLPRPKEALNQSPSAEQRIFFPSCAVSKAGNTQSIPPFWKPSSGEKSLAVSSRRLIQSFPVEVLLPIERMRSGKGCVFWKIIFEYCIIRSAFLQGRFPPPIGQNVEKKSRNL